MLIVLISQHSIMGLPVNTTTEKETCSVGFKMIDDKCMPMDSMTTTVPLEHSSTTTQPMIIHEKQKFTKLNVPKRYGSCPEGMKHGKHGICQKIQSFNTTKVMVETTTELYENVGGVETIKGCPEGTKPDEQGACQSIKSSNSTKNITNPKLLLRKDGSCPDNYKMIDGRCLYIKLKTNSTLYPNGVNGQDSVSTLMQPKTGVDESSKVELVPVLADNSCPEGTEYSEYGLCQKHAHVSNSNPRMKPNGSCPDDFELINGKCTYKNSKLHVSLESTTTPKMMRTPESTTPVEDFVRTEKFSTSTVAVESDYEPQSRPTKIPKMLRTPASTTPVEDLIRTEKFSTSTAVAVEPDYEPKSKPTTTPKIMRTLESTTPVEDFISNEKLSTSTVAVEPDYKPQLKLTKTLRVMMTPQTTTTMMMTPQTTTKMKVTPQTTTPVENLISNEKLSTTTFAVELDNKPQSKVTSSPL
jgi:sulfur carrier protein ThiS